MKQLSHLPCLEFEQIKQSSNPESIAVLKSQVQRGSCDLYLRPKDNIRIQMYKLAMPYQSLTSFLLPPGFEEKGPSDADPGYGSHRKQIAFRMLMAPRHRLIKNAIALLNFEKRIMQCHHYRRQGNYHKSLATNSSRGERLYIHEHSIAPL